eukprot:4758968-Lingulodinium_polyedra.AAC.1
MHPAPWTPGSFWGAGCMHVWWRPCALVHACSPAAARGPPETRPPADRSTSSSSVQSAAPHVRARARTFAVAA